MTYRWKNGLPIGLSLLQPNAWPWTQGYGYDAAERLARVSSPAGTFSYSYQGGGNLVTNLALPNGAAIVNAFDGVGRLTGTWLRNGAGTILNSHTYNVDPAHHRIRQARWDGSYVNYAYDNLGALKAAFGYERNGAARLHEQFGYAYDAAGNLNYRTNNGLVQRFEVNNLNELADVTRRGTLTVAGTTGSAATEVTVNGIPANRYNDWTFALAGFPLADGDNVYTVIAQDRYGRKDRNSITVNLPAMVRFTYDRNGNLIRDGSRNFDYDDENQLICVTVPNSWKSEFIYDGRMRRRIRKEFIWSANAWMPTREVRYFYDGDLVIQERDGGNAPTVSYTRGRDLSGGLQGAGGIGGLLARSDVSGPVPSHAYYHADGNGNITALINAQQFVVARYLYDPFGNTLAKAGPLCDVNLYRFSSKEVHLASGLVYYLYRFYDPNLQRWLNRDPIQEQGGINLYAFAGNQPVGRVDETGMRVIDWDDYFNQWIHAHPGLTAEQHDWVEWQLARGCVGLTCVNLGWTKNDWPDTSNCYKTRKQAMRRAREMKKDCSCGNSSSPQIFSIHFWNNTGSDNLSPDMKVNPATGKVGLSNWDHEPRNFHQVNYDYGYLLPNGKILHANHYHNPDRNGDGIGDYFPSSSISKAKVKVNRRFLWTLVGHFGPAYNSEVWCVACDGGGYVSK